MVRAFYRACRLDGAAPPHDNVTLKIWYQGDLEAESDASNTGIVPPAEHDAPWPVVVILPGINVGPESYAWLAERLAANGLVAVTYSHIAEEMPGFISLTPGLDISALAPGEYGTRPSATALSAILGEIETMNTEGILEGHIATGQVVLVGHSAGGSVALFNANREWFPPVCGAVSYGAHTAAATVLGYEENTILPLPDSVPLMLIGGTRDGVIAGSAHRYGDNEGKPLQRILDSFERGIQSSRDDCFFVEINGANHFSFAHPHDEATGRGFLDWEETGDAGTIRECIAEALLTFINVATGRGDNMDNLTSNALVASLQRR